MMKLLVKGKNPYASLPKCATIYVFYPYKKLDESTGFYLNFTEA
jgi:hypothetical protein